jgi:hypothetical protein
LEAEGNTGDYRVNGTSGRSDFEFETADFADERRFDLYLR